MCFNFLKSYYLDIMVAVISALTISLSLLKALADSLNIFSLLFSNIVSILNLSPLHDFQITPDEQQQDSVATEAQEVTMAQLFAEASQELKLNNLP